MKTQPTLVLAGLFADDANIIADSLGSRETFSQGPAMGMRVITFYLSYVGRRLSPSRRRTLERAKKLLAARVKREL